MFGFDKATLMAVGKYGLATAFASILLGVFIKIHFMQIDQIEEFGNIHKQQTEAMNEAQREVAISQTKVAEAVNDISATLSDVSKELDDVGDQMRLENKTSESLHSSVRRVLEKVWGDFQEQQP